MLNATIIERVSSISYPNVYITINYMDQKNEINLKGFEYKFWRPIQFTI